MHGTIRYWAPLATSAVFSPPHLSVSRLAGTTCSGRPSRLAPPSTEMLGVRRTASRLQSTTRAVRSPGIVGTQVYIPNRFVDQAKLEAHHGVPSGKYTKGLGQRSMAFCDVDEDVQSMALTVTQSLLETCNIDPRDIGRLEVGTESMVDKSKSVKSTVISLLNAQGVYNVEGVDTMNACYGGTQALFNTLAWMHSPEYDGRYGIVLAGDIAVYPEGPARVTGGAGMVALLLGPDALLTFDPFRFSHMEHAYDFYKPHMDSEYPLVDGHLSNDCYLKALNNCWDGYRARFEQHYGREPAFGSLGTRDLVSGGVDYALFHHPYAKLVQKSFGVMWDTSDAAHSGRSAPLDAKAQKEGSKELFARMTEPSTWLSCELGNLYTGSLYLSLISHLCRAPLEHLPGSRAALFSYGSGLASTMFSATLAGGDKATDVTRWVQQLRDSLRLDERMAARCEATPEEYSEAMLRREQKRYGDLNDSTPRQQPGVYYLRSVHEKTRHRVYSMQQ